MRTLFTHINTLATVDTGGLNEKRGKSAEKAGILHDTAILTEDGKIIDVFPLPDPNIEAHERVSLRGKTVTPGLIDCHTHSMFAGERSDEFAAKLRGETYEQIAQRGGGIIKTVKTTRDCASESLVKCTIKRVWEFIRQGVTTLEIKSGYGLDYENELKMLYAIREVSRFVPINIVPSCLGAHIVPPEYSQKRQEYLHLLCEKLLPAIVENGLANFCDAFCEPSAFSPIEIEAVFATARSLGLPVRLHTDQFNSTGGVQTALKFGAHSIDHLEKVDKKLIAGIAASDTVSVLLPGVSFFLNYEFAPARELLDSDGIVALSTDFNPGSSHILNLHFILWIAAMRMKMTYAEALAGVTINAAKALGLNSLTGSIEIGKKADFAVFGCQSIDDIFYSVGQNLVEMTIRNGRIIYRKENV